MKRRSSRFAVQHAGMSLALILVLVLPGCVLLGAGAATVGGCALLDRNDDDQVTAQEASAGLFDAWDANNDDALSRSEFDAGVSGSDAFDGWADEFEDWDDNDNGTLSVAEFSAGISEEGTTAWMDRQCDELGL